jgi:predicted transcriptional regulator
MRNVTLAVDDSLLDRARALAERRKTTLNALVRSLLAREVEQEDRIAEAREGMRKLIEESTLEFEPGTDVKELSRRHAGLLPGHQHPDMGSAKKSR